MTTGTVALLDAELVRKVLILEAEIARKWNVRLGS